MSPDDTKQAFDLSLLNDQLSQLFGFADGVSDVVEHLLTIESKDDLSEYLEQLLGSATSKQKTFHNFVDNLLRYQRGQELIVEESKADPVILKAVEPALDNDKKVSAPVNTKSAAKAKVTERKIQKVPIQATLPTSRKSSPSQRVLTKQRTQPQQTQILTPPKADFRKLSSLPKPPTGDAQVKSCGCFGTQHSVIVNCLYCGRISCSAEADILFCPSCRYQLHSKDDPIRIECVPSEALELKNKLLLRDKEQTSQTKVYTDYMDHKSTWNTNQESSDAQALEQQRTDTIHRRQGIQLQLGI